MDKNPYRIEDLLKEVCPVAQLRKRAKKARHVMKEAYKALRSEKEPSPWQRWLLDQYHMLDAQFDQAVSDLKAFHGNTSSLFPVLEAHYSHGTDPLTQDSLGSLLARIREQQELEENDFAFLLPALRTILLLSAAFAVDGTSGIRPYTREQLLSRVCGDLAALAGIDFDLLACTYSETEHIFMRDPAGIYPRMEDVSRRYYRQAAARIARRCGTAQSQVARDILACAEKGKEERERHVGFYLMNHDPALEHSWKRAAGQILLVLLGAFVFLRLTGFVFYSILSLLPFYVLVGRFFRHTRPRHLPRMKLDERPVVAAVIVALLGEGGQVEKRLEELFFSNPGEHMVYCLLADYPENRKQWRPQDDVLLQSAKDSIGHLNQKYGMRFVLLVRRRVWCGTQEKYCGWERKRGAVLELAHLIRGGDTSFSTLEGALDTLKEARYLLLLDSDTRLGWDAGDKLLSAALHPLNAPVMDEDGRVVRGHAVFCPHLENRLAGTRFARLIGGPGGHSIYAGENASRLWDFYGEAPFTGKGLIDLAAFERALTRRFPEGCILSHDVIEGSFLRPAFVGDALAEEEVPAGSKAWSARRHRWVRGDWQNLRFLGREYHIDGMVRKNTISFPARWFLIQNLLRSLSAPAFLLIVVFSSFYDNTASYVLIFLSLLAYGKHFWMLAHAAGINLDAICRSLYRMAISKKKLLEWSTSAQAASQKEARPHFIKSNLFQLLFGLALCLLSVNWLGRLAGAAFFACPFIERRLSRMPPAEETAPLGLQREKIIGWSGQMLAYYEQFANKKNHWLPPDNVQLDPVFAQARRTSPTNIGMMLLSYLAARDMGLLDSAALSVRLTRTMDTLEKLETRDGNLYNWYSTEDLRILPPSFVSSVDSGNLLCCLVALREGIREYYAEEPKLHRVSERISQMLSKADYSIFYDKQYHLLSTGIDEKGKMGGAHYDYLMSEARTASYYAVATRQVPLAHWRALNRTMGKEGGPLSWTGTMFEYLMPHLLLPAKPRTLLWQGVWSAVICQKKRAGAPWGISESAYFALDENLNYLYKAHGVQSLGVKRGLDQELVVAPYASFLTLPFSFREAFENLENLERLGMVGKYGFYEALDFTPGRKGMVCSFMAHHIGMSMVACANVLRGNIMQKRFMRDPQMAAAEALLEETPLPERKGKLRMKDWERRVRPKDVSLEIPSPASASPDCTMLSNGIMTHYLAASGAGFLRYGDVDVTRRSRDLLASPQGLFVAAHCCGETITPTAAPFYGKGHTAAFTGKEAVFKAAGQSFDVEQRMALYRDLPVEQCTLRVRNQTGGKMIAELLFYFEPVLSRHDDYEAHPAFCKLFVTGGRDPESGDIYFSRRRRDGSAGICLAAGFLKKESYAYTLKREEATPYPDGLAHLLYSEGVQMDGGSATPDACCAMRMQIAIPARGQHDVVLLLACGESPEACAEAMKKARAGNNPLSALPLMNESVTARIGTRLLPALLFPVPLSQPQQEAVLDCKGVIPSESIPIVIYEYSGQSILDAVLRFWRFMKLHRMAFRLYVAGAPEELRLPRGVFRAGDDPDAMCALRAASAAITGAYPEQASQAFAPMELAPVTAPAIPESPERFDVVGGAFIGRRFFADRVTPLPFSHILANAQFGCLLQDASLGYTWWRNARENRLTPWKNDVATGDDGERIRLVCAGRQYDLCKGARASFSASEARYDAVCGAVRTTLVVRVDTSAAVKYMDVYLENLGETEAEVICAYAMEPVLGVSRADARQISFEQYRGCLLLHKRGMWAAVHVPGEYPTYMADRAAFLSGNWTAQELLPNNDPIAGTLVRKRLPGRRKEKIRFILSAGASREEALDLASKPQPLQEKQQRDILISTPSEPLDCFFNAFAAHQVLSGRLLGRTGFYQSSGAYGFRDQLQDAGAYLYFDFNMTREHLLRCCAAQFYEGDVLHWWHPLAEGARGIRTRFSDDLLWLPFTVCDYVEAAPDGMALLREQAPYCTGEALMDGEQERYMHTGITKETESVYRHCVRALDRGFRLGAHGIPLIGCGDWNDGFSNIGTGGQGESVWLAMFLIWVLERFAPLAERMDDGAYAQRCRERAEALRKAVDSMCWDGKWYLRAFFDDGSPLGSHQNKECRIDLLPQAFAVLSGMPDQVRVESAVSQALAQLVDKEHGIIRLFTPPFTSPAQNPGYISAYPAGIRENGGQYTHGALWLVMALLRMGKADEAWELLDKICPASRCTSASIAREMKTEPYYIAADVYTNSGCYGHGGWTIYTGAAGWFCRIVLGELLGLRFVEGNLSVQPCVPEKWGGFGVTITANGSHIRIEARRTGERKLEVDGKAAAFVPLDGESHRVFVEY